MAALSTRLNSQTTGLLQNQLFVVGDIKASLLTEVEFQALMGPEWVLADGRAVAGSAYESITGLGVIPDCRGRFLRMLGTGSAALRGLQGQATAVNGLSNASSTVTGSTNLDHNHASTSSGGQSANHTHTRTIFYAVGTFSNGQGGLITSGGSGVATNFGTSEATSNNSVGHTHALDLPALGTSNVSLASGSAAAQTISGDAETRPNNITVNYFVKIN